MRILSSPATRRLLGVLIATVLSLVIAAPALGYNEENVDHIRLRRLDPIHCSTPIRIVAYLTDEDGRPVRGAAVNFSLLNARKGDSLEPKHTVSNASGRAFTTLKLSCKAGNRVVKASVPGDGSARLLVSFKVRDEDKDGDHDNDKDGDHDDDRARRPNELEVAIAMPPANGPGSGDPVMSIAMMRADATSVGSTRPASLALTSGLLINMLSLTGTLIIGMLFMSRIRPIPVVATARRRSPG